MTLRRELTYTRFFQKQMYVSFVLRVVTENNSLGFSLRASFTHLTVALNTMPVNSAASNIRPPLVDLPEVTATGLVENVTSVVLAFFV